MDNSYCKIDLNKNHEILGVVSSVCSMTQYYFTRRKGSKPVRKSRTLSFFSLKDGYIIFPRGWFWYVYDKLIDRGHTFEFTDSRKPFNLNPIELINLSLYDIIAFDKKVCKNYNRSSSPYFCFTFLFSIMQIVTDQFSVMLE